MDDVVRDSLRGCGPQFSVIEIRLRHLRESEGAFVESPTLSVLQPKAFRRAQIRAFRARPQRAIMSHTMPAKR